MNIADYKGVWVFAEQREGELQKVSLELLFVPNLNITLSTSIAFV